MNVQVKICGIRSLVAAQTAVEAGADFIGFNFVSSSKRYIDPKKALEISMHIKGKIQLVGVFMNERLDKVVEIADLLDLDVVQLHGMETDEYLKKIKRPIIKRMNNNVKTKFPSRFLLIDRVEQGKGSMVDLEKAKLLCATTPTFFSGGLTPENVAAIVGQVRPFGVDVASGIETDRKEDMKKIKQFVTNAKGVTV